MWMEVLQEDGCFNAGEAHIKVSGMPGSKRPIYRNARHGRLQLYQKLIAHCANAQGIRLALLRKDAARLAEPDT